MSINIIDTNIGIFYHKEAKEIKEYAKKLFKTLYRDFDKPNEKGLMIDTYFHEVNDYLNLENYEYSFYVFLVDDNLVLTNVENVDEPKSFIVSFTDNIGNSKFNTNKVYLSHKKENVELGLFTFLASRLYSQRSMNLFLSHTKRGEIGFEIARDYNAYIQNHTKLNSFIDINAISYGDVIKEEIDNSLSKDNTIFVGFNTELYSTSKWTQYELLEAKKKNIPVIIIDCIDDKLDRSFPYMGNSLVLRNRFIGDIQKNIFKEIINKFPNKEKNGLKSFFTECIESNIDGIVKKLYRQDTENNIRDVLKEAVRLKINESKMQKFKNAHNLNNLITFNNPPELIDLIHLAGGQNLNILYPEPPVTIEELDILKTTNHNIFTPLSYISDSNLNKNIGISISEVNGEFENGFENIHLYTAQEEIAKYLLYTNSKIIYGGNINFKGEFNFVKVLANISNKYRFKDKNIINYSPHKYFKDIPIEIRAEYKNIIEFIDFNKDQDDDKNLEIMRKEMASKCDARIVIGGKYYEGKYSGLLEETYQTIKAGKPVFLIGGFGGFTQYMIEYIQGKEVDKFPFNSSTKHMEAKKTIKNTKLNHLSDKENEILFNSRSIEEIIFYIMKGINSQKQYI